MKAGSSWALAFGSKLDWALASVLLAGLTGRAAAQQGLPPAPTAAGSRQALPGANESRDPFAEQTASKLTHLREDERRKRLMADTARLVALTHELQAEVDNTSRDVLSLDVIRKAAEIEKLAHDVRERMKN